MRWQEVGENCIMRYFTSIIRMSKSRRMRWPVHVARMRTKTNAYRILVGKPEGNRALGRPRHRWIDNIEIDLRDILIGNRTSILLVVQPVVWPQYPPRYPGSSYWKRR
jgi:hypothetical protein